MNGDTKKTLFADHTKFDDSTPKTDADTNMTADAQLGYPLELRSGSPARRRAVKNPNYGEYLVEHRRDDAVAETLTRFVRHSARTSLKDAFYG